LVLAVIATLPAVAPPAIADADPTAANRVERSAALAGAKELRAAVHAYSAAFLSGRERPAWRLLTPRCRKAIGRASFNTVVNTAGDLYGFLPIRRYAATIAGAKARVTYKYAVRRLNQTREPWRLVEGRWRNNDC
jgi:hypothetical protein